MLVHRLDSMAIDIVCVSMHVRACLCACVRTCVGVYERVCVYMCICMYICVCICACMHAHILTFVGM